MDLDNRAIYDELVRRADDQHAAMLEHINALFPQFVSAKLDGDDEPVPTLPVSPNGHKPRGRNKRSAPEYQGEKIHKGRQPGSKRCKSCGGMFVKNAHVLVNEDGKSVVYCISCNADREEAIA